MPTIEEDSLRDLILRYGVILGTRRTEHQKNRFLLAARGQLERCGMPVEIDMAVARLKGAGAKRYRNLYAGDLKRADWVIETYYDTPAMTVPRRRSRSFDPGWLRRDLAMNSVFCLLVVAVLAAGLWILIVPQVRVAGALSIWGVLFLVLCLAGLAAVTKMREGLAARGNLVRNSSSLIAIFHLAKLLARLPSAPRVAIALLDEGCRSELGRTMLFRRLRGAKAKVIELDALGAPGEAVCFTCSPTPRHWSASVLPLPASDRRSRGDYLMTAGSMEGCAGIHLRIDDRGDIDEVTMHSRVHLLEQLVIS